MRGEMLCFKVGYIKQNAPLKWRCVRVNLFYHRNRKKDFKKGKEKKTENFFC